MAIHRSPAIPEGQRIYFVSLGCPKNQVDTELMLGQVQAAGHALVDAPEGADVIVVNTCAFIDAAKEESVDTILEMAQHKQSGAQKLVVTGCLAQRYADELAKDIPEIDHILGSSDFPSIAKALEARPESIMSGPQRSKDRKHPTGRVPPGEARSAPRGAKPMAKGRALPVIQVAETPAYIYDHDAPRVRIGARHSAYVKIAEGCDRPCAFCIIPKLRGPQRSRAIDDIVAEVRALGRDGVVEVNLIAQDLTRYGWDAGTSPEARQNLAQLLRALGTVDGVSWIRLHYTFPSAFDDELIDVIASEPKVVKYIDVPLQHISDAMLRRMRRGHSSRITRELVQKLRARIDNLVLRTTFIVGHPGETAAEFDELCAFVAESKFDRAGAFTFSVEPGTVSAILPHRVDPDVAAERQETLMEIQRQISRARHEAMVGRELDVLVEGVSSESEYLMEGRWYGQAPGIDGVTYLSDRQVPPGSLVRARVTQASDYDLAATLEI
ncbi:MAG TPA: 30S ribosomal protein S12 methylthiotransferase RimO [Kofleriaceae bacterium]|jgi:ribosomal protein S12 methylthiotransferase|nr:30S ribosomal protein S12 methylthiotransferase RimO [Kofleriaceae bacterium]